MREGGREGGRGRGRGEKERRRSGREKGGMEEQRYNGRGVSKNIEKVNVYIIRVR